MSDWFLNLPIPLMALIIFAVTFVVAACVYVVVVRLAVDDRRARAFKAFSPAMLPPLGIIFGLLVGFVAVQVWNDFDKAKLAVATEASAVRVVDLDKQVLAVEACDLSHEDSLLVRPTPDKAFPFQLCPSALLDGEKLV